MKRPPVIVVQLVHIFGPLKGQIQDFSGGKISIGRYSSSDLRYPEDLTIVSRKHAEIIRDGNQFKLIDHSANGTYVNGKRVKEAYLKNGDVITFAEGGPKVSFLTQLKESPPEIEEIQLESLKQKEPEVDRKPLLEKKPLKSKLKPVAEEPVRVSVQSVQVPLVIQFGPIIRSFKELPVTIGRSPKCGFVMTHPLIYDQHAQIFFRENQYWIKDLTGQNLISINRQPISLQTPLNQDDEISLSPKGPTFRFIGEGRLAEVLESHQDISVSGQQQEISEKKNHIKKPKGIVSRFRKFLDSR